MATLVYHPQGETAEDTIRELTTVINVMHGHGLTPQVYLADHERLALIVDGGYNKLAMVQLECEWEHKLYPDLILELEEV